MWTFLLDPIFQAVFGLMALSALGYVVFDLYEEARDPSPGFTTVRKRARKASRAPRNTGAAEAPRQRAYVEPSVEMWTDNQGETRGRVERGPCQGMRLEDMSREDLERQNAYCREHDYPAAVALDNYLHKRFSQRKRNETRVDGTMSRAQAFRELGLSDDASDSEIHAAYRRMIMKHHPDHGGSHAKAARINQAKEVLVG